MADLPRFPNDLVATAGSSVPQPNNLIFEPYVEFVALLWENRIESFNKLCFRVSSTDYLNTSIVSHVLKAC